jgi:UDP-N-acetylmuramoyl-L-alanyl-D-glutamate--2,6-diaminopimelate ligase
MKLSKLLHGCEYIDITTTSSGQAGDLMCRPGTVDREHWSSCSLDRDISGVAYNSKEIEKGYLFVAIRGERFDGHDFIQDAMERGAVAFVYEKGADIPFQELHPVITSTHPVIFIRVEHSRQTLPCIAHNFYGEPSKGLFMIGLTGTNGKTTTTYILKSILESWGKEVGLIGTIQYLIKDRIYPAPYTTPESLEFHGLLKDMLLSGCTHVISEISSHALAQFRVDRAVVKVAVFTNLSRDHLDFHRTMEEYFKAKKRLFREILDKNGTAIINSDDPYGRRLIALCLPSKTILTYGLHDGADIRAVDIENSYQGLSFTILFRGKRYHIGSRLIGLPNVYNILAAVGVARSLGISWEDIKEGLSALEHIPGRFEKIEAGQDFLCIVDYAHSEDSLERLIDTARVLIARRSKQDDLHNSSPRIITVFGCGGDRDHGKRPRMGAVATRLSDLVIITSDNPRSEEPNDIIREIESGTMRDNYIVEPDRKKAIRKAVSTAREGDIVLIAGKGHEDYQEIKGVRYHFSDKEVIDEFIKNKLNVQNAV